MLDIIVTHYNEPWETGQPFFDMLGCQRGINFADIRVLLVHDGEGRFPNRYFSRYPYTVVQYEIPHAGVSAARNYGLDMATAKWVQFCDFDDMYSNAYALKCIMEHLDKDLDFIWTPFMAEYDQDGKLFVQEKGENIVFVHGKFYRREWLNGLGLRFPEGIHHSEDSAFNALVNELAHVGRRAKIRMPFPAYIWCTRPDSVSSDPANEERNLMGFIDRNFYVVEEFMRRGIPYVRMVGRMFADAYCAFHQKDRKFPEYENYFIGEARQYLPVFAELQPDEFPALMTAAMSNYSGRIYDEGESFTAWIQRIKNEGVKAHDGN